MQFDVVIIKSGRYETFVSDSGRTVSLGDVLRTTAILKLFPQKKILWLADIRAKEVIPSKENLTVLELTPENVTKCQAPLFINLEREPWLTQPLEKKDTVLGYNFENGAWVLKDSKKKSYTLGEWVAYCRNHGASGWGRMLQLLAGENSFDGFPEFSKPSVSIVSDVGLNWHAGTKWPSKTINPSVWKRLEENLTPKYSVSWQKGLDSIDEYVKWIASNRVIISVDSLGLHLANAMNIPVIGLFGPTSPELHDAGPRSRYLLFKPPKSAYACVPCWKSECFQKIHCSEYLDFNKVYEHVNEFLGGLAR